jgi:hypothetical protein
MLEHFTEEEQDGCDRCEDWMSAWQLAKKRYAA